ncbi:MAG: restriction endonuclease, partial [Candidatus Eremiobacterota bacterium]
VVNSINSVALHEFHHALNGQGRNDTDTRAARVASIYDRVKTHIHSPLSMAGLLGDIAANAYLYGVCRAREPVADSEPLPNTTRGEVFEGYCKNLMERMFPDYTWYQQGAHKRDERGLDLIGNKLDPGASERRTIGVQVKFHKPGTSLKKEEWRNFLAGCFARKVSTAIFITTGRLSGDQRREAGEAGVLVIEGREEINRLARQHGLGEFKLS